MTPTHKVILTAFIYALTRLNKKLPITVQNQLGMIQDVAKHTRELEMVLLNYTDLAILYKEEFARFLVDASDRNKGYLPIFNNNDYNTDLGNLAEMICHSGNPVQAAKDILDPSISGSIQKFFSQLLNQQNSQ